MLGVIYFLEVYFRMSSKLVTNLFHGWTAIFRPMIIKQAGAELGQAQLPIGTKLFFD